MAAPPAGASAPAANSIAALGGQAPTPPTGAVLGEFVEVQPASGAVGEVRLRAVDIAGEVPQGTVDIVVGEPLGEFLGELLGIERLPRTGGVPPTQVIGLLGLIAAGCGLALRRRGR